MGNSVQNRLRREYLLKLFESDIPGFVRCFRCGALLDAETMTVDRIMPGAAGGRYYRSNCRPACGPCNSQIGDRGAMHAELIAAAVEESKLDPEALAQRVVALSSALRGVMSHDRCWCDHHVTEEHTPACAYAAHLLGVERAT